MTSTAMLALLPLIVISVTAIVVLLATAFFRQHLLIVALTLLGLLASLSSIVIAARTIAAAGAYAALPVTQLLFVDSFTLVYTAALLIAGIIVVLFAYGYQKRHAEPAEEFYVLLLLALLGAVTLTFSSHFASFFLGLEILSVSLYTLIAYQRIPHNIEAGVKYLVLSSVSSAFLLFGIALIYADLGTLTFAGLAARTAGGLHTPLTLVGLGLVITGIGFKLALAPFYFWAPDVYQGSPAPTTAFIATVSKGALAAVLLRLFLPLHIQRSLPLQTVFAMLAIASMFIGNLLALRQNNIKRLLAYSSVSNFGYLLVAFLAGGAWGATAVTFFLFGYIITTLAAFGVVSVLSDPQRDADEMDDYRGLAWRRPGLAVVLTLALLSLIGMPLSAGFIGKFLLLYAGVQSHLWYLVIILVLNSAIGLYYYLRVIIAMFLHPEECPTGCDIPAPATPLDAAALTALTLALLYLGLSPSPLISLIRAVVAGIGRF